MSSGHNKAMITCLWKVGYYAINLFPVNKAEALWSFYSLENTDMRIVPHGSVISFIFRKSEFRFFLSMLAVLAIILNSD